MDYKKLIITIVLSVCFMGVSYSGTISESGGFLQYDNVNVCLVDGTSIFSSIQYEQYGINRTLFSTTDKNITVCSIGADYTTIQDSMIEISQFQYHELNINLCNETFNENVTVPPFFARRDGIDGLEQVSVQIIGNMANSSKVKIGSLFISNVVGAIPLQIKGIEIMNSNPVDDESSGIGIYGSQEIGLVNISFSGGVNGIVCYSSRCTLNGVNFGSSVLSGWGAKVKHGGVIIEQNNPVTPKPSTGTVGTYAYEVGQGHIIFRGTQSDATGTLSKVLVTNGFALDSENGRIYNVNTFPETVYFEDDIEITGEISGGFKSTGLINLGNGGSFTISSGNVTIDRTYIEIDTEGAGATDDLNCIKGGTQGDIIYIHQVTGSRDVVYKHSNCPDTQYRLMINGKADFSADSPLDVLTCINVGIGWSCQFIDTV